MKRKIFRDNTEKNTVTNRKFYIITNNKGEMRICNDHYYPYTVPLFSRRREAECYLNDLKISKTIDNSYRVKRVNVCITLP